MAGKAKRPESVSAGTEKRNEGTTGRACEEKCPDGIKSGQRAYQERRRKNDRCLKRNRRTLRTGWNPKSRGL